MSEQRHKIGRQRFELTIEDRDQAGHWQDQVSQTFKNEIIPKIDQLFNDISSPEEVVRIDSLTLDLGYLTSTDFGQELKSKLLQQLEETLVAKIYRARETTVAAGSREEDVSIVKKEEDLHSAFFTFLRTGLITWQTEETERTPQCLLDAVLQEESRRMSPLLIPLLQSPSVRKRLVLQFGIIDLQRFTCWLFPSAADEVIAFGKAWLDLTNTLLRVDRKKDASSEKQLEDQIHQVGYESLWIALSGQSVPGIKALASVWESIIELLKTESTVQTWHVGKAARETLRRGKTSRTKAIQSLRVVVEELSLLSEDAAIDDRDERRRNGAKPLEESTDDELPDEKGEAQLLDQDRPVQHEEAPPVFDKETSKNGSLDTPSEQPADKAVDGGEPSASQARKSVEDGSPTSSPRTGRTERRKNDEEPPDHQTPLPPLERPPMPDLDMLPVNNAGLVILHPFLKYFFQGVGLVEQEEFVSEDAQHKAIHLLQYPLSQGNEVAEHDLLLNKLLCGVPIEAPVPRSVDLTEEEKEESMHLLKAVLGQWSALKTEDPQGLIESFLKREGTLAYSNGWTLQVDRNTFDILLDRLPWGLSLIKLPWNAEMIYVEW